MHRSDTALSPYKVLIVEDDEMLRETMVSLMEDCGANVLGVSNGAEAFALIQREWFDAVITDIRMSGGNGITLIQNINAHFDQKRPMVFICSGFSDLDAHDYSQLNIAAVFEKPFQLTDMVDRVLDCLESQSP